MNPVVLWKTIWVAIIGVIVVSPVVAGILIINSILGG
jgi:hypothetical protein